MQNHQCNLNIHYTIPEDEWNKITSIYTEMPYQLGFIGGAGWRYGTETEDKHISVSVEPSGLQFFAQLPLEEWRDWIELFKRKASNMLGYDIGEPEDGYEFK